jgi:predicted PurR-regulated permease PerM
MLAAVRRLGSARKRAPGSQSIRRSNVTIVIIVIVVLAIIVLGLVLTPVGHAIRTSPNKLESSDRYRRPPEE